MFFFSFFIIIIIIIVIVIIIITNSFQLSWKILIKPFIFANVYAVVLRLCNVLL